MREGGQTIGIFSECEGGKASPPVQLPLLPPGLHQMHQLLQNPFNINQNQIHQFLQQAQVQTSHYIEVL